jgi:nucleotide-binding universal stress UspA family protein
VSAVTAWEIPPFIFLTPTTTEADYKDEAQRAQEHVLAEVLAEESGVPISRQVLEGRAGIVLTNAADAADLLVIGTHGRKEYPRMHLGSVAGYCVHHAPCPVLVVRRAGSGR